MSQPSEHIFYFCCECSPDPKLDSMSLCLLRMTCEKHGPCWHRKMFRRDDGSFEPELLQPHQLWLSLG